MNRNLESRIEVIVPIEHESGRRVLKSILDVQMAPCKNAWELQPDGSYVRPFALSEVDCQRELIGFVEQRPLSAEQPRRKRRQRFARRSSQQ
jgi:polyphosphate kinase